MLLVKKDDKMIGYGKISNKDVIPFIDEDNDKTYIVCVSLENNKIVEIKLLEYISKGSEFEKILKNLFLVCKDKNIYELYDLEAL